MMILPRFLDWFRQHLSEYDAVMFDIDGTLTLGPNPLPGNQQLIQFLRDSSYPFFFLTNDGIHTHAEKRRQLERGGIPALEEEIVSSSDALPAFARQHGLSGKPVCLLGAWKGQSDYLLTAEMIPKTVDELDGCHAIFIGEGRFDWCTDIQKVLNFMYKHPELPLFVSNPDSFWSAGADGSLGVGAGGLARFILAILKDMGITPECTFLGKPNPGIYLATIEQLQKRFKLSVIDNKRLLMVGDALFSDILGGNRLGMTTVLMMTGVTTPEILQNATGENLPTFAFNHLA